MTETQADWVERPKPADVAALTTRPAPRPKLRRERGVQQSPSVLDPRVVAGGVVAAVGLAAAVLLGRRRRR